MDENDQAHYNGVLTEEINDRIKRVQESLDGLANVPQRLTSLEEKVDLLLEERLATRAAIKDLSTVVDNHETQITKLETA